MTQALRLVLPWPPSLNHYWSTVHGRRVLSRQGRRYRLEVIAAWWALPVVERVTFDPMARLGVAAIYHYTTRGRYDLDNFFKCLGDAIVHCRIIADDSQFDEVHLFRGELHPVRSVEVHIWQRDEAESLIETRDHIDVGTARVPRTARAPGMVHPATRQGGLEEHAVIPHTR